MTMTIYDYADTAVKFEIPAKNVDDIDLIDITVLSGDETGKVILKNGDIICFDACYDRGGYRIHSFYDGSYFVRETEKIKQWLDFKPKHNETASYERQRIFE